MGEKHWSVICSPDVGIELETPQCMEGCSNQLSHLTRALFAFYSLPGIFLFLTSLRHCWLNWVIFSVPSLPFLCARGGLKQMKLTQRFDLLVSPNCLVVKFPPFQKLAIPLHPIFISPLCFSSLSSRFPCSGIWSSFLLECSAHVPFLPSYHFMFFFTPLYHI